MFIGEISTEVLFLLVLYGGTMISTFIACIYLCMRQGNAFVADVTPPVRLRRWAAAFFAASFLSHIWWLLFYIYSGDIHSASYIVIATFDSLTLLTTIAGTLLSMLQDRKRPIWPFIAATIPYAMLLLMSIAYPGGHLLRIAIVYALLLYAVFSVYMVFAVRQYGRWLRDNYADLEHKEVWVSHVLVIVILIFIIIYGLDSNNLMISYVVQFIGFALFCLLLWRVETLPQLVENGVVEQAYSPSVPETSRAIGLPLATEGTQEPDSPTQEKQASSISSNNIEELLVKCCVSTQLYLKHDLTLLQLAQAVGTNRFYLSQYFSRQGITYNAYINNLRINHFLSLYRKAADSGQNISAQQLASESGYRSYSTFSLAFKQRMGQSVIAWIRETSK